ncbi:exopolyphosphatase [Xenococcus sp. PCC 7305]|uniref:Ppx/GppA phosphatase family protein n=1 Tax=Xenococcus sp. PCC 7305 TaxID=102125 RepID=UPI0002ACF246|nr:Ppx/GppA phosphatase family protein [Xenococcus sp. PCC 7305]ELS05159.1 exopolyphosphatase [Xenococcus sp. PCC 7305]
MVNSIYQPSVDTPFSVSQTKQVIAAIDIGTNSVHMVVVEVDPKLPAFHIIAKEKDTVRLGDRDPDTGNLTEEAIARALKAIKRCKDLAESLKVRQIIAVATSATREAGNGIAFLHRIKSELGIGVNLISGKEEARRIYLGVLSGMDFGDRPHVMIDIGGGSTELILADIREPRFLSSTKVGAVRLTKEFVHCDPISKEELNYLKAYVRGMLERPVEEIWHNLQLNENPRLVGTSGTIETLALIHALDRQGTEPNPLNGYQLTLEDIEEVIDKLSEMSYEERFDIPGISDKRAEIIVPGAIILLEAMKMLKMKSVTICERALREGIIVDWMLTHGLISDRLRYQNEVRNRNVFKIAHKYQVDLEYGQRVANFALSLFEQTKEHLHQWGQGEKELLWAAAILHNCGIYISHSAHHKHSYYLIRNAELLGFTELELALIANIARYHRKSKPKKKHTSYQDLPSKRYQLMVRQLSSILRIAVALDRRNKGAIERVKCDFDARQKILKMAVVPHEIGDDCALELWSLEYKKPIFEEEFDIQIAARLES